MAAEAVKQVAGYIQNSTDKSDYMRIAPVEPVESVAVRTFAYFPAMDQVVTKTGGKP